MPSDIWNTLHKPKWYKERTKRNEQGQSMSWLIKLPNQGCRQFCIWKIRITFYQMLANRFCTKHLEKCYNITNSQGKRHQRPKKTISVVLSVLYKLFTKVVMNRICTSDSNQLRKPTGIRSGYSTTDHIRVINQVVEKYTEYTRLLCMAQ